MRAIDGNVKTLFMQVSKIRDQGKHSPEKEDVSKAIQARQDRQEYELKGIDATVKSLKQSSSKAALSPPPRSNDEAKTLQSLQIQIDRQNQEHSTLENAVLKLQQVSKGNKDEKSIEKLHQLKLLSAKFDKQEQELRFIEQTVKQIQLANDKDKA